VNNLGLCRSQETNKTLLIDFFLKSNSLFHFIRKILISEGELNFVPAHLCLEFRVFLINASTKKYTQEKRIISYWFKDVFPANERAGEAQEFFKKLVSPVNFPRGNNSQIDICFEIFRLTTIKAIF
jgi:hypothetical protein